MCFTRFQLLVPTLYSIFYHLGSMVVTENVCRIVFKFQMVNIVCLAKAVLILSFFLHSSLRQIIAIIKTIEEKTHRNFVKLFMFLDSENGKPGKVTNSLTKQIA